LIRLRAGVSREAVVIDLTCVGKGTRQKEAILGKAALFEQTFGRPLLVDTNLFLEDTRLETAPADAG
jgi:hypothetical protein